ncbi:MAG: cyclic nucleotide-binding domain-containing protein [Anaerolineae bacterium]|nr:cyclic nucleotide-binding domain-containing protein [Anaerolineae bacterium]
MKALIDFMQQHGTERLLAPGEIICQQGSPSDGVYYLKHGRLGVYREEHGEHFRLSEIVPGEMVGELGAATGEVRTATVQAELPSYVIYITTDDFLRAISSSPELIAEIVSLVARRLTEADTARITLGQSYQSAMTRVQALSSEKAQLEELLRLREEMANMIIHDLRNPLGIITGSLDVLERIATGVLQMDATSIVDMMSRASQRMKHLVDTLLDIARLEAGEMVLQPISLDLHSMVQDILAEERAMADSLDITLENQLPASLPAVLADSTLIQRVMINLLDNALKFTPAGGKVWIAAQPGTEVVQVQVIDTGPGIPADERDRIFEKFTQVKGREGARKGSGLGLAFCRMAVEAHHGRIWAEEGPAGVGSCLAFTLPAAD